MTKTTLVRQLSVAVTLVGAFSLSRTAPAAATEDCTPEQWAGCYCGASAGCEGAYGTPPDGMCYLGQPTTCVPLPNGNAQCQIQCYLWEGEECETELEFCP